MIEQDRDAPSHSHRPLDHVSQEPPWLCNYAIIIALVAIISEPLRRYSCSIRHLSWNRQKPAGRHLHLGALSVVSKLVV